MEKKVIKGNTYIIGARTDTVIKQEEVGFEVTIPANTQQWVYAHCDTFTIEGDCIVDPFVQATR